MKKIIAAIVVMAILLTVCAPALALTVEPSLEPAMPLPGETVRVSFRVQNTTEFELTDITIAGYGLNGTQSVPSSVSPGYALQFSLPNVKIEGDVLGQSLSYILSWMENGSPKSQEVKVPVGGGAPAEITIKRTASRASGAQGDKITFTYTLANPSEQLMTDIELKDSIAGNSAIKSGLTLEPGDAQEILYDYTLGSEDALSQPSVAYRVGGESKTATAEPLTVSVVNVKVAISVTQGENTPEGTDFTLTLSNTGNQTVGKLQVADELGNKINKDPFSLEAGKEKTLPYRVTTDVERNVSFVVTGVDALGQPFEDITKEYQVRPYIDSALVKVAMTVTVLEQLTDSGRMKVRFTINNTSDVAVENAIVEEGQLGTIFTLDSLAKGETAREEELRVGSPRELAFTLTVQDPSGATHPFTAKVNAEYAPVEATPAPTPEGTPELDPDQAVGGGISSTLTTVLIVLAALMALAGIALLVLSIYERKNNARLEEQAAHLNEDEAEDENGAVPPARPEPPAAPAQGRAQAAPQPRPSAQPPQEPARQQQPRQQPPVQQRQQQPQSGAPYRGEQAPTRPAPPQQPREAGQRPYQQQPPPYVNRDARERPAQYEGTNPPYGSQSARPTQSQQPPVRPAAQPPIRPENHGQGVNQPPRWVEPVREEEPQAPPVVRNQVRRVRPMEKDDE